MATPVNPLDNLKIYTYHIAMFMGATNDDLKNAIDNFDWSQGTTRTVANGFCLINSVTDAAQSIDELRIDQVAPLMGLGGSTLAPIGEIRVRIVEPGDCMFMSKIAALMQTIQVSAFSGALFAFKIKFVGRDADNNIIDTSLNANTDVAPIYCLLLDVKSSFTQMGSTYEFHFITANTFGAFSGNQHENSKHIGSLRYGTSFYASTIGEALQKLQTNIQKDYDRQYSEHILSSDGRGRKLNFSVTDGGSFSGMTIDTVNNNSSDPTEKGNLVFGPGTSIIDCIHIIASYSPELRKMLADSKEGALQPLHPGVKIYQITSQATLTTDSVNVDYQMVLYEGSGKNEFTFEFYFSPKYNTDVLSFDLTANGGYYAFLGADPLQSNAVNAGLQPNNFTGRNDNNIPPAKNADRQVTQPSQAKTTIDSSVQKNDWKITSPLPDVFRSGFHQGSSDYSKERSEALECLSRYMAIDNMQKTLHIRGHLEILTLSMSQLIGVKEGMWVKLNIYSKDADDRTAQPVKYFYDDFYETMAVTHTFRDGKFEQELTLIMMNFPGTLK